MEIHGVDMNMRGKTENEMTMAHKRQENYLKMKEKVENEMTMTRKGMKMIWWRHGNGMNMASKWHETGRTVAWRWHEIDMKRI